MAKKDDDTKAEKKAPAPSAHCEGNCAACGRFARLRPDGSQECADAERCQASQDRDRIMVALDADNVALRARIVELEAALKAAQK